MCDFTIKLWHTIGTKRVMLPWLFLKIVFVLLLLLFYKREMAGSLLIENEILQDTSVFCVSTCARIMCICVWVSVGQRQTLPYLKLVHFCLFPSFEVGNTKKQMFPPQHKQGGRQHCSHCYHSSRVKPGWLPWPLKECLVSLISCMPKQSWRNWPRSGTYST